MSETSNSTALPGAASSTTSTPGVDELNISLARITQTLDVILERQDGFNQRLGQVEHSGIIATPSTLGQGPLVSPSAALGQGPTITSSPSGPGPMTPAPPISTATPPHPFVNTRRQGRRVALPHQSPSTPPMPPQHAQAWQPSGGPWGQASSTPWRPTTTSSAVQNTASTDATTTDESGVTPLQVFRAMPREDKETFRRIMGAMGTTTRDFLATVSSSQLPTDALQRVAVRLGPAIAPNTSTDASELGPDDDADPVADDTAAPVPITGALASSAAPALTVTPDRSEEEPLPPSRLPPVVTTSAATPPALG
ncbi:unnamed protein product [Tilletia laevis]|uniref:Uncharacterized protein n=2 Tax=Tilletia TaxID=13289 RepID=A0A9N8LVQ2_9BASI|nr:unnamed protein product [Tilletia laevis]CAD7066732.1 unnamed protein product [Tilletia caries]